MWYLFQEALMCEGKHFAGEWTVWHWMGTVPILIAIGKSLGSGKSLDSTHASRRFMGLAFGRITSNGDAGECV